MMRLLKMLIVVPLLAIVAIPDVGRGIRDIWRELGEFS